jgi:glyoxylase I family protein
MLMRTDHIEIVPEDFERSLAFYCDLLGFSVNHRYPLNAPPYVELAYLSQGDIGLELMRIENPEPRQDPGTRAGLRCIAWEVEDMDAVLADYNAKGIETTWGPLVTDAFVRAEICDPDGNAIELRQWFKT